MYAKNTHTAGQSTYSRRVKIKGDLKLDGENNNIGDNKRLIKSNQHNNRY